MGECIGLDFGTTYSAVAHLSDESGRIAPKAIDFGDSERSITSLESLVVIGEDEEARIGDEAVPAMKEKGVSIYSGFKMLLNCNDGHLLKKRGYGEKTPKEITELFISGLFERVKWARPECRDVEKAVVGVPYVWTENGDDTRKYEVAEIVQRVTGASTVEFQSEPTLACAYFVDEINKRRKGQGQFEGYILIIDYGGGTLDITLCKTESNGGKSTIEVCGEGWGAGENKEGTIGSAGLLFMEKVSDIILSDNGIKVEDKSNPAYQIFKKQVELAIKSQTRILKENFLKKWDLYGDPDGPKYEKSIGVSVSYGDSEESFPIKYSTLVRAYNEKGSIRETLENKLAEAKKYMDDNNIPYNDYINGSFKIATIGGFCKFALTEKQIRDDIDWLRSHEDSLDTRYTELDEAVSPKNRELAIAFGAALNANNIVVIKKQFPYTLCFYGETYATDINGNRIKKNGKDVLVANEAEEFIMFRENEEYIPGKPVFFGIQEKDDNGNKVLRRIAVSGECIPYIRRRRKNKKPSPAKQPTYELAIPKNDDLYLAMAMERNENLTLYVYSQNVFDSLSKEEQESPINKALIGEPKSFPNIDKLLGSLIV